MADHENCVPAVSIGFTKMVLIPSRVECRSQQVCVREREHPTSTRGISVAGTVPGIAHLNLSEAGRGCCALSDCQTVKARKESGGRVNGCLFIGIATSGISS